MDKKDLDAFEQLLNEQLDQLRNHAGDTVGALLHMSDHPADLLDLAAYESDRSTLLRIRDRESNLIRKIERTLSAIKDGTFGICEECGEEISIARLKARPVTTHCIRCKTKQEAWEKVVGF